jgi:hypothetical protein
MKNYGTELPEREFMGKKLVGGYIHNDALGITTLAEVKLLEMRGIIKWFEEDNCWKYIPGPALWAYASMPRPRIDPPKDNKPISTEELF